MKIPAGFENLGNTCYMVEKKNKNADQDRTLTYRFAPRTRLCSVSAQFLNFRTLSTSMNLLDGSARVQPC